MLQLLLAAPSSGSGKTTLVNLLLRFYDFFIRSACNLVQILFFSLMHRANFRLRIR